VFDEGFAHDPSSDFDDFRRLSGLGVLHLPNRLLEAGSRALVAMVEPKAAAPAILAPAFATSGAFTVGGGGGARPATEGAEAAVPWTARQIRISCYLQIFEGLVFTLHGSVSN
jgi:hypothetical protein